MSTRKDKQADLEPRVAFRQCASQRRTRPQSSVLSIRLAPDQWARLEREAAGRTLSAYARDQLFASLNSGRGGRSEPVRDRQTVARILGALGKSPQTGTLKGVLRACDEGAIVLNAEAEDALRRTCARIDALRDDLIAALGLRPE